MQAIETLEQEHRVIEKVLDALEAYTARLGSGEIDDHGDLGRFVTFFREFADRCHHGKEEDILFGALEAAGFPVDAGPIAVMLAEHGEGRRLVGILAGIADREQRLSPAERKLASVTAIAYARLLREHIRKEDHGLFPMAESQIPAGARTALEMAFASFEEAEMGRGTHEGLHALADELVGRHLPCDHYHASHGCAEGFGLRL